VVIFLALSGSPARGARTGGKLGQLNSHSHSGAIAMLIKGCHRSKHIKGQTSVSWLGRGNGDTRSVSGQLSARHAFKTREKDSLSSSFFFSIAVLTSLLVHAFGPNEYTSFAGYCFTNISDISEHVSTLNELLHASLTDRFQT